MYVDVHGYMSICTYTYVYIYIYIYRCIYTYKGDGATTAVDGGQAEGPAGEGARVHGFPEGQDGPCSIHKYV